MMPFLSGIEVYRALRGMHETRMIPIIMLSARGEEGDRPLALIVADDCHLETVFAVVSRVRAVLRRASGAAK